MHDLSLVKTENSTWNCVLTVEVQRTDLFTCIFKDCPYVRVTLEVRCDFKAKLVFQGKLPLRGREYHCTGLFEAVDKAFSPRKSK